MPDVCLNKVYLLDNQGLEGDVRLSLGFGYPVLIKSWEEINGKPLRVVSIKSLGSFPIGHEWNSTNVQAYFLDDYRNQFLVSTWFLKEMPDDYQEPLPKCICSIEMLMQRGCGCGGF